MAEAFGLPIVAWYFELNSGPAWVGDRLLPLGFGRRLVALVERLDRLAQNVRIVDEIVADERAQLLLLRRGELVGAAGRAARVAARGEAGGEAERRSVSSNVSSFGGGLHGAPADSRRPLVATIATCVMSDPPF